MGVAAGAPVFCDSKQARCTCGADELRYPSHARREDDWMSMEVTNSAVMNGERIDPWSTFKAEVEASKMVWNCMVSEEPPEKGYIADSATGNTVVWKADGFVLLDDPDTTKSLSMAEHQDGFGTEHADGPVLKPVVALKSTTHYLGPPADEGADDQKCVRPLIVRKQSQALIPIEEDERYIV
mmetsp:Transcript_39326/g.122381  ORF Transcript_39326/g.122381 Transcript_39326/m.122381 type:complete len:182 (+) Transcript_39326:116-661(+)